MNHDPLGDPQLQALEARLSAMAPSTPAARQRQLLYECARAAGRNAGAKSLRSWQTATAAFALLAIGLSVLLARDGSSLTQHIAAPPAPVESSPSSITEELAFPQLVERRTAKIELDAWRLPPSTAAFDDELARFKLTDPETRSFSLGALTRTFLEQ